MSDTSSPVRRLLALLDLESLGPDLYRGISPRAGWQRVFGGQVVAQALIAAGRTVDTRPPHSLHGYFLRPGNPAVPILYEVDRVRDGRSFVTRRVVALQNDLAIFTMVASFHVREPGLDHHAPPPDVPGPDDIPSATEAREQYMATAPATLRSFWESDCPLDLRPLDYRHYLTRETLEPVQNIWLRASEPVPDDPLLHAAILAYISDLTLLDTALFAHGRSFLDSDLQMASLDHAVWFHRAFRVDEWLLYAQDSPNSAGARGFGRGQIFTRDGRLVASTAQEGLIRRITPHA